MDKLVKAEIAKTAIKLEVLHVIDSMIDRKKWTPNGIKELKDDIDSYGFNPDHFDKVVEELNLYPDDYIVINPDTDADLNKILNVFSVSTWKWSENEGQVIVHIDDKQKDDVIPGIISSFDFLQIKADIS